MKKLILLFIITFRTVYCYSQAGDMIVIKKNGINVRTFLRGGYASFITITGDWINSRIVDIRNDTLYYREVILQRVPTIGGGSRMDTVATPLRGIYYKDIAAVPKKRESFSYIKNGTLFMLGGGGYILINLVNGAYLHYAPFGKENRGGLITAAGVFSVGYLLHKLHQPYLKIGKKYTVGYVKVW